MNCHWISCITVTVVCLFCLVCGFYAHFTFCLAHLSYRLWERDYIQNWKTEFKFCTVNTGNPCSALSATQTLTRLSDGGEFISSCSHHSRGGHGFVRWQWREGSPVWGQHSFFRRPSVCCCGPSGTWGGGPWGRAVGSSCSTCKEFFPGVYGSIGLIHFAKHLSHSEVERTCWLDSAC